MLDPSLIPQVESVRAFNRFYTRRIGVLTSHLLDSAFSLAEGRVLYELGSRGGCIAGDLVRDLELDPGYLSRILTRFRKDGLLTVKALPDDRRRKRLELTAKGRREYGGLDARSREQARSMLRSVDPRQREELVRAMRTIRRELGDPVPAGDIRLRQHRPGDMGWVVERHGALYSKEFGWNSGFEALVAEIVSKFLRENQSAREGCWIAEVDGERAGSVFLVQGTQEVARLRLLLVEPGARGLGLGRRLVDECIRFAREKGYGKLSLWTNSVLVSARRIYEAAGFELVAEETHRRFGPELVGQTWDLRL